jgi:MYXO-CTERM domain-containing protein
MPRLEDGPPAARPAYASLEPSKAASSTAAHAGRSAPQALSVSATADATAHEEASDDAGCSAAPRRANGPRPLFAALAIALGALGLRRRREAQSRNARIGFDAVPVQRSK